MILSVWCDVVTVSIGPERKEPSAKIFAGADAVNAKGDMKSSIKGLVKLLSRSEEL